MTNQSSSLSLSTVYRNWWPLAGSWLMMALELPIVSAFIARLPNPEINLAAYGGIVIPISLLIEAPVVMFLAASTALTKNWERYTTLRLYMISSGIFLSLFHFFLAVSPLYYVVTETWIGAPEKIISPARIGLMIMTPWTAAIAYRRFKQGILIRYERTKPVAVGTVIRLVSMLLVLIVGYSFTNAGGVELGASSMAMGTIMEAIYIGIITRRLINHKLRDKVTSDTPITVWSFLKYYFPLALTTMFTFFIQPLGSAAMSRMPESLKSLAIWPVMFGLLFILRSGGIAYKEVVVSLMKRESSWQALKKFALLLILVTTFFLVLIAGTPVASLYFISIEGLKSSLLGFANNALWCATFIPALTVLLNWFQGVLVYSGDTWGIIESVFLFFVLTALFLGVGIVVGTLPGLYVTLLALTGGWLAQTAWLWYRCKPVVQT